MTRGDFYASKFGGGWRKARKQSTCDRQHGCGVRCGAIIPAGAQYFDTNAVKPNQSNPHVKMRLCAACATGELN